jgi:nucleoside-diphosphate-sugar epimerase
VEGVGLSAVRILLTGHDGYVGTVLGPMLAAAGHAVIGVDSLLFHDCGFGPDGAAASLRNGGAVDIRDVGPDSLLGVDAVVHLAAISNDPLGDLRPACTMAINHLATVRLATLAKRAGVARFVLSSSCSLYGAHGDAAIDEEAELRPVTPYGESKMLSECALHALADDGFSPVYLRSATAFGLSPRLRGDLVVNNLTGLAFTTGEVLMRSNGTPWRPLVHVEDMARAFLAAVEAPRPLVHDQAFNVGSTAENYRIRDVAEIVESIVPDSVVRFADGAGPDLRNYRVDCGKLAAVLPSAVPRWTVEDGVRQLYAAYLANGLTIDDLNCRLLRIEHVKALQAAGLVDADLRWNHGRPAIADVAGAAASTGAAGE